MLWVPGIMVLVAGALLFGIGQRLPAGVAVRRWLRLGGGLRVALGAVLLFLGNALAQR